MTGWRLRPALALAAACGCGTPSIPLFTSSGGSCVVAPGTPERDTVSVGLLGPVHVGRAPVPATDAERQLFHHLYETLVRVDCEGELTPGLAESWNVSEDGRRWAFRLRAGARFWDGSTVTAEDVLASWRTNEGVATWFADSGGVEVQVMTQHVLEVRPRDPAMFSPRVMADPTLAVARRIDAARWPLGSGPYAVTLAEGGVIVAAPPRGLRRDDLPALLFRRAAAGARDLLDSGVDMLVVRDRSVIEYAATKMAYRIVTLPWDRTYLLATPWARESAAANGAALVAELTSAVAVEARVPEGAGWWTGTPCDGQRRIAPRGGTAPSERLVYPASDSTARGLAERLVALASSGTLDGVLGVDRGRLAVAGLDEASFWDALASGRERGYVIAVPSTVLDRCAALGALAGRMPWLYDVAPAPGLRALVDVRARVVLRQGLEGVRLTWDGTPYLSVAGRP